MIISKEKEFPNLRPTGFEIIDRNASRRIRKAAGIPNSIKDPSLRFQIGTGKRAEAVGAKPPFNLFDIENGYQTDGFLRQGVDKYAEMVTKNGWTLTSNNVEATDYLKKRFQLFSYMMERPFDLFITDVVTDYIKYGNVFIVIARTTKPSPFEGISAKGLNNKNPIGGLFLLNPTTLEVNLSDSGKPLGWIQRIRGRKEKTFKAEDVLHFFYKRTSNSIWGSSVLLPVIDDVRMYRQCEEMVQKLLYKHINPLFHQEVPDTIGDGRGLQDDVEDAYKRTQEMAPDGFMITPPGHKIHVLGAEGSALNAEGYLKIFKSRIYAGLGLSSPVMGEGQSISAGSADTMTASMHDRVKAYQSDLSTYFTQFILDEVLREGGFDPLGDDYTEWNWSEIELDAQIKMDNHHADMYTKGVFTHDEARRGARKDPITPEQEKDLYLHKTQLPLLLAKGATPDSASSNKVSDHVDRPSNQHGKRLSPKIKAALDSYHSLCTVYCRTGIPENIWDSSMIPFAAEVCPLLSQNHRFSDLVQLLGDLSSLLCNREYINNSYINGCFEHYERKFQEIFEAGVSS
jgi:hypothetical protein